MRFVTRVALALGANSARAMTTAPHQTANLEMEAGCVRVEFESSACRLPEMRGSED
jgi:hypothetical protein